MDAMKPNEKDAGGAHGPSTLRLSLFENTPYLVGLPSVAHHHPMLVKPKAGKKVAPAPVRPAEPRSLRKEVDVGDGVHRCKTPPIPFPECHIPRTSSELELSEREAAAEWRERAMFQRLVSGMRERRAWNDAWRAEEAEAEAKAARNEQQRRRMQLHEEALRLARLSSRRSMGAPDLNPCAAAPPSQPSLQPQAEDPKKTSTVDVIPHDSQQDRALHLSDVLSKVATEDWSVEGVFAREEVQDPAEPHLLRPFAVPLQVHGDACMPPFPALPTFVGYEALGTHQDNDAGADTDDAMVFSMDL